METLEELTGRVSSSWKLSPFMASEARRIISSALKEKDPEELTDTIRTITDFPRQVKFPLAYLGKCISKVAPKAAKQPEPKKADKPATVYRVTRLADGWLEYPQPEAGNIIQERISEAADRVNALSFAELMREFYGRDKPVDWAHPGWFEKKDAFGQGYARMVYGSKLEDYNRHTWISLYEEAKAENTSIHELCRRYGLSYKALRQ